MRVIADLITETLEGRRDSEVKKRVKAKVLEFSCQFPVYEDLRLLP